MNYILERGVKRIGTDGPSMGSVNPEEARQLREVPGLSTAWRQALSQY